ncbi:MAG: hypothetical protein AAGB13_11700 [Cyanobacteria bacterium P01_F01_bin.33]
MSFGDLIGDLVKGGISALEASAEIERYLDKLSSSDDHVQFQIIKEMNRNRGDDQSWAHEFLRQIKIRMKEDDRLKSAYNKIATAGVAGMITNALSK